MTRRAIFLTATLACALGRSALGGQPCFKVRDLVAHARTIRVVVVGDLIGWSPANFEGKVVRTSADGRPVKALYRIRVVEEFKGTGETEYAALGPFPRRRPRPGQPTWVIGPGQPLFAGERYLIFASGDPLTIDICPPTAPAANADDALSTLRSHLKKEPRRHRQRGKR